MTSRETYCEGQAVIDNCQLPYLPYIRDNFQQQLYYSHPTNTQFAYLLHDINHILCILV